MQDTAKTAPLAQPRDLESTLPPMQALRLVGVPELRKNTLRRALSGEASPRSAIKAFCQQCVGYEDIVDGVKNCTAKACPLYAYRPYRNK